MPNVVVRALSGALFVAAIVGCILLGMSTFCVLFCLVAALLLNEFNGLLSDHDLAQVNNTVSVVGGVYLFIAFFLYCSGSAGPAVFAPYILSLIFILASGLYFKQPDPIGTWAYTFAGHLYIALPIALLNTLAFNPIYSPTLPLAVFVFLWIDDTGAYCCGSLFGRHKLFPRVSPGKSWEGSIGGAIFVVIAAAVIGYLVGGMQGGYSIPVWIGLGLTVVMFGTLGDLVESLFKRTLGIKDSGSILPGHGGMLDRFDSSLMAIPAAVIYFYTLSLF